MNIVKAILFFLLVFHKLYAAGKDSVFVSVKETDSSYIYTLYHRTNNFLKKIYEINSEDESSIDYEYHYKDSILDYDCLSLYNNACACNQYIFFDRRTKIFYITKNFFEGFHIEKQSVNFKDKTLILYSNENAKNIINVSSLGGDIFQDYASIGKRVLEKIFIFPIGQKRAESIFIHQKE